MSISAFLLELAKHGIRITLKGDRLQLSAASGILTPQLRTEIAARKPEIVAFLSANDGTDDFVLKKAEGDRLPLAFGQQRLWFLHKLDPIAPAYNLGASVTLPGAVDERTLNIAVRDTARRHGSLRTIFEETDGLPSQVVTDVLPSLTIADLRDLPTAQVGQRMREVVGAELERPFDLAATPPFRALLVRESADVARLILVIHHIIADGWSLGLLVKEIRETYELLASGGSTASTELPWQYADYASSEQRWFLDSDQQAHANYWTEKFSANLSSLPLPFDRQRPPVLGTKGAGYAFTIPEEVANELRALSRQLGVTLFTTLLTVFKVLLRRYSAHDDIVVGTAVANRRRIELENVIGMFASTLVLRTDLSGDPSIRELLQRVNDTVLDAQEHQDYPFEKIVELAHMERSLSHSPLFQTAFVLHNTPNRGSYENIGSGSMFELSLYVWDTPGDLTAVWEYNPELFDADTLARMVGHFLTTAKAVVENPGERISQLPLLTSDERIQLLGDWNRTAEQFPDNRCIHELFEAQVDATPKAIALVAQQTEGGDEVSLTYRDLDRRANRLAHRLRKMGVTADARVAIALNRSVDMVVAVLAVLKAGGAYVPLDHSHPADRLAFTIDDAAVTALITTQSVRRAVATVDCPVVDLDTDGALVAAESDARPTAIAQSKNLAYVIYTSGSTGTPKGVMIEHRSVVNLLTSMAGRPGLTAADTMLSVTTLAFDIAGMEIYLPLIVGARVVIASRAVAVDGLQLANAIVQSRATIMQATPATWRMLIDSGWKNPTGIRVLTGGEALPRRLADDLLATGADVWNLYGPTETTIWSTAQRVGPDGDPMPIGRPIANTTLYVLDAQQQLVPVNVPGELYIGGVGLARGYHNRPDLTAERFVRNPFVADASARLYRTGDQVRYAPDGTLEYLGRLDTQVKVRGFRIELGEIESVLATHPRVQNAVVIAREDTPGDTRLVAYLVGGDGDAISSVDLRRWLATLLPQYMLPSAFVFVDAFPLTPNGKVDRRALLTLGTGTQQASEGTVTLRPGLESLVAQVWRDTLGVSQVWANDNFFDLGGNSLLGIRLLSNLEKVVGQRLPVSVLFEGQTVRSMTTALGQDSGDDPLALAVRIRSGSGDEPPLFVFPGVNGNVIGYEGLAHQLATDRAVYGLRSVGLTGDTEPLESIEHIAARFLEDVRKVQPHGPYHFVGFCIGGIVAYEMTQELIKNGEHVDLLAMVGTWPPHAVDAMMPTARSSSKLAHLRARLTRHVRTLWAQPPGERIAYVRKYARIALRMIEQRDVYHRDDDAVRRDWVSVTNRRAATQYKPAQYAGDVVLVLPSSIPRPAHRDARLAWRGFVQGQTEIVRLPGNDSGALLKPPHLQRLVEVLSSRLKAAFVETQ